MVQNDYVYEESSRRLVVGLILIVSLSFIYFGYRHNVPLLILTPPLISFLLCAWALIANRTSGVAFVGDHLKLYSGPWQRVLSTTDIDAIYVTYWMEGAPTLKLKLVTGANVTIPSTCLGSSSEFLKAFQTRNLTIVRTN